MLVYLRDSENSYECLTETSGTLHYQDKQKLLKRKLLKSLMRAYLFLILTHYGKKTYFI